MNKFLVAALMASAVGASSAASAQVRIENPISAGTQVVLRTAETVSGADQTLKVGRSVALELAQPVTVDGRTTIPAGTSATATVTSIDPSVAGRPGRIVARLQNLRFGSHTIRLAGGLEGTGMGTAMIPSGLSVRGYIDEDVPVDVIVPVILPNPVVLAMPVPPTAPAVAKETVVKETMVTTTRKPSLVIENTPSGTIVVSRPTEVRSTTIKTIDRPNDVITNVKTVRSIETTQGRTSRPRMPARGVAGDASVSQGGVVTRYTY
jgi:hypothetical protein